MVGARMLGWGVALLVLSRAGVAASVEAVTAAPADRMVVSADVGGGWAQAGFRNGGTDVVRSAPTFNVKALVGYRSGALDAGLVAGGLLTSSFNGDATPGQPTSRAPESLRLAHAGGFLAWRPARAQRLSIGGRVEGAYAWLPGTMSAVLAPFAAATISTATVYGGIGALDASYALVSSPRVGVVVSAELFAGALRGDYAPTTIYLFPRGAAASVGLRWP